MSRAALAGIAGVFAVQFACGASSGDDDFLDAPDEDWSPDDRPTEPPPTGGKWEPVEEVDGCGRVTLRWRVVDEVCAGTDDPRYLDAFRAPIFRDGALIDDRLYAVDASHLWVLDVSDRTAPERVHLTGGLGHPLAVATHGDVPWIAAGHHGLVRLDLADPDAPARDEAVALPGTALDVVVRGDRAWVALGHAGVARVDLSGDVPVVEALHEVPGFAAAVDADGGLLAVAACGALVLLDDATGEVLGETWLDDDEPPPAKDVALVGDVAFVAAGRHGAVAVSVADPTQPAVLGNCTVHDPLFYASGVRAQDGTLYVAGGEWGILPVDVGAPVEACPDDPPEEEVDEEDTGKADCGTSPPWEVVPWEDAYVPPAPPATRRPRQGAPPIDRGRDPIQTLPAGPHVFAFGDATRIGVRAVDIRRTDDPELPKVGRYEEPRWVEGVAAHGERVLVPGLGGGVFERADDTALLHRVATPVGVHDAVAGTFLSDGRWVFATRDQELHVEGEAEVLSVPARVWPGGLAAVGGRLAVPLDAEVLTLDVATGATEAWPTGRVAALPSAVVPTEGGLALAAAEWAAPVVLAGPAEAPVALAPSPAFDFVDVRDVAAWRVAPPRRLLLAAGPELVEVRSFGGRAAVAVGAAGVALPPGDYVAGAVVGETLILATARRGDYRSTLVRVALEASGPAVRQVVAFTGMVAGVAAAGDRVYVADADVGVRVFALAGGALAPLGTVRLDAEVTP